MARTTLEEVQAILPTGSSLTDAQINAAISAATCTVDQIVDGCGSHLSEACLVQVETYTAAHFAAATELALSRTSESDPCGGSARYGFTMGKGILGSPFGQMANTLSRGCLAQLDKAPVGLFAIGCV